MSDLLKQTEDAIRTVEDGEALADHVLDALEFVARLGEVHRLLKGRLESAAIKWIEINGEIVSGDKRWYVGTNKVTKCVNVKATLEALLEKTGGDLMAVAECMSTSAWKPATTKKILGDTSLFVTEEKPDLETGKPSKKLKVLDPKFLD